MVVGNKELVELVWTDDLGISKKEARKLLKKMFDKIGELMDTGEYDRFVIPRLGAFKKDIRKSHKVVFNVIRMFHAGLVTEEQLIKTVNKIKDDCKGKGTLYLVYSALQASTQKYLVGDYSNLSSIIFTENERADLERYRLDKQNETGRGAESSVSNDR